MIPESPVQVSASCLRKDVSFVSGGETIAAHLYCPANGVAVHSWPAVVTAPGFGGVKEMLVAAYAIPLAEAGIACLSLDYRHFGSSTGQPRQHLDPEKQVEDMLAGIDFLSEHDEIDSGRLGVWGTSMSGGHALTVAARDSRVKSAAAIIPFVAPGKPSGNVFAIWRAFLADVVKRRFGSDHSTIPIFAEEPGQFAVMASDGGWDWMQGITNDAPNYRNEVTIESLYKVGQYQPGKLVGSLTVPTLFIAAESDSITPAEPIRAAFDKATCSKEYQAYPNTHFELFGDHLEATVDRTVSWFEEHL